MSMRKGIIILSLCLCAATTLVAASQEDKVLFGKWTFASDKILLNKGKDYIRNTKYDSALVVYSVLANRYDHNRQDKEKIEHSVRAMNDLGYLYFYGYYDYLKSYTYLHHARIIAQKYGFLSDLAYIHLNLGNLYQTIAEIQKDMYFQQKTMQSFKLAFCYALKAKNWNLIQIIYGNMLMINLDQTSFHTMESEVRTYRQLHFPKGTRMVEYNNNLYQVICCMRENRYRDAIRYTQLMQQNINTQETPERYMASVISIQAHLYSLMGNQKMAIHLYRDKLMTIIDTTDIKDLKPQCFLVLSDYYKSIGRADSASLFKLKYLEAKDSITNEHQLHTAGELHFLARLQNANEKMNLMEAQQRQHFIIIILCICIVFISLASLLYILYKNKQLRHNQQQLYLRMLDILKTDEQIRKQRDLYENQIQMISKETSLPKNIKTVKYQNSSLEEEKKDIIFKKIQKVMENVEIITASDFTLSMLAQQVGISYPQASQVINEKVGKNFNALLGEYRIKEACNRLSDLQHYGNLTIEGIASGVGFKSRTNFVAIFKRVTGLTPSEYQRIAKMSK